MPRHGGRYAVVAENLPVPLDDEFAFGLELIIDGLTEMLAHQGKPKRRNG